MGYFDVKMETVYKVGIVGGGVSVGVLCVVLFLVGLVVVHPTSRDLVDRVSFRIMAYAMVASLGQAFCNILLVTVPKSKCASVVWLAMFTWALSTFLFLCIGLNLQLVLIHGMNGQKMEKYYVGVSLALATIFTIPPLPAKQYGWDPFIDACWFGSRDVNERLKWQIPFEFSWPLLCVLCEAITLVVIMWDLFQHKVIQSNRSKTKVVRDRLRRTILRIALYPVVSSAFNIITVFGDSYASVSGHPLQTQTDYTVTLMVTTAWVIRGIVYSLLAVFDPSLMRGLRAICGLLETTQTHEIGGSWTRSIIQLSQVVQMQDHGLAEVNCTEMTSTPNKASVNLERDSDEVGPEATKGLAILSRHGLMEEQHVVEIRRHI